MTAVSFDRGHAGRGQTILLRVALIGVAFVRCNRRGARISPARTNGCAAPDQVPPRDHDRAEKPRPGGSRAEFVVDHIEAPGTILRTIPKDRWKEPLEYDIQQLYLQSAGPNGAMRFQASLTNAKPPGEIHSDGEFGPWDRQDPGGTQAGHRSKESTLSKMRICRYSKESPGSYLQKATMRECWAGPKPRAAPILRILWSN